MEEKDFQEEVNTQNADFGINADENAAGTTYLNDPVEEESQLEKLNAELQEQKDKYVRLFAEFDNYRRRTARENLEIREEGVRPLPLPWLFPEHSPNREVRADSHLD